MARNHKTSGRSSWHGLVFVLVFSLLLLGCGGSSDLAPVSGTVTYHGTPVKGGTLIFSPISSDQNKQPGRPAVAEIHSDGTYTLKTGTSQEGALMGKQHVTFTPPPQELTEQQRKDPNYNAPPPLYLGLVPKTADVEVKSGSNTIDIELVPEKSS